MRVESGTLYAYGVFREHAFDFQKEFVSLAEIASFYRKCLMSFPKEAYPSFLLFVDNWRYLLVTQDTCDIHYHYCFSDY